MEHLEAGRLSLLDLGVHDFICLKANSVVGNGSIFPPGIWHGSATAILAQCPCGEISERTVRRSLHHLEEIGFIKRWQTPGKRGNYPILVNRFSVRDVSGSEYYISAEKTTDWRHPDLESAAEAPRAVSERVHELSGNKEIKNKETTTSSRSATGTNGNHSSSPTQEAVRRVWSYYIEKLGKNPNLLSHTKTRMAKGLARFEEAKKKTDGDPAKAEELLKLAVDALAASEWHVGANDRSKRYDSWERNLFPSQEKFEWWLEKAQSL